MRRRVTGWTNRHFKPARYHEIITGTIVTATPDLAFRSIADGEPICSFLKRRNKIAALSRMRTALKSGRLMLRLFCYLGDDVRAKDMSFEIPVETVNQKLQNAQYEISTPPEIVEGVPIEAEEIGLIKRYTVVIE